MAIKKNSGRQTVLFSVLTINFADIVAGAQAVVSLPIGAIVVGGGALTAETAVTGGSLSAITASIGDVTTAARYLAATSVFTATNTPLVPTGFKTTALQPDVIITFAMTGGTTPTAGVLRLTVPYVVDGRAEVSQG